MLCEHKSWLELLCSRVYSVQQQEIQFRISRVKNIWGSLSGCWLGDKAMIEWGNNRDGRSLSGALPLPPSLHLLKEIFLSSSLGIRGAHSLSPGQEISDKAEEKKRGKDLEICSRIGLWQIELSDWWYYNPVLWLIWGGGLSGLKH